MKAKLLILLLSLCCVIHLFSTLFFSLKFKLFVYIQFFRVTFFFSIIVFFFYLFFTNQQKANSNAKFDRQLPFYVCVIQSCYSKKRKSDTLMLIMKKYRESEK